MNAVDLKLDQLFKSRTDAESAEILLVMPLSLFVWKPGEIADRCRGIGFEAGAAYAEVVAESLMTPRNPDGSLAGDLADRVTTAGAPLVELARAARPVGDDEGICRRAVVAGFPTILPETADGHPVTPVPNPACVCPPDRLTRERCTAWRFK